MKRLGDMSAASLWVGAALLLLWPGACGPADPSALNSTTAVSGVGGGLVDDDATGGAGGGGSGAGTADGGGVSAPLYVGLTPNPLQASADPVTSSDVLLAELMALAAGVRVVFISVPWAEFDGELMAATIANFSEKELRVVVTLEVVAGHASHRPAALADLAWDDTDVIEAMQATVDEQLVVGDGAIDAIIIGRRSDVYLADSALGLNEADPEAFVDFMTAAVGYLRSMGPAALGAAPGLSYQPDNSSDDYTALLELGSTMAFSYFPGLGQDSVPASLAVAKDLDTMAELAGERPVLLHELGFTSATTLDSDEERQAQFFDTVFAALAPRREGFPYINVYELHDVGDAACGDIAVEQSLDPSAAEMRYLCAAGLRDLDGEAKASWDQFIEAAASFATP